MLTKEMKLTIDLLGVLSHEPLKIHEIAKLIGTTYSEANKILWKLRKKGLVISRAGPNGGTVCVPRFLTLRDIIDIWRGESKISRNPSRGDIAMEAWLIAAENIPIRTFGG